MKRLLALLLTLASTPALQCAAAAQDGGPLKRRADLGAAVAPPSEGKPARIVRFRDASVLEKAGLKAGDEIIAVNERALVDANGFLKVWRSLREGDRVHLRAKRGDQAVEVSVVAPGMRRESFPGLRLEYGHAASAKGYRVRYYASYPENAAGRFPVVVFIPWLSCGPVENPLRAPDGWSTMLETVMRESGALVVRLEKPGVGDSEGPDCADTDLDHDLQAYRAGIRAALSHPRADPDRLFLFGGSIGMALAPVLGQEFAVRGLVVSGGMARTWHEHILGFERRRLTLAGGSPAEVNDRMRKFGELYAMTLAGGLTPGEAIARRPHLKDAWYDEPAHQFGRRAAYYQQVNALDIEGAWARIAVPVLVVWGEYDWFMSREDQERVLAIVNARRPGLATLEVRPRMNHHFETFPDAAKAFADEDGVPDAGAAGLIAEWIRRHARGG